MFKKILLYGSVLGAGLGCMRPPTRIDFLNVQSEQKTVFSVNGGVSSAHAAATKAGIYILQQGGNAIDAAIAVQLALAVCYPQAGNLGGGGVMVMRLKDGTVHTLDFRETAPACASANMYLDSAGSVMSDKSIKGHAASGVPGTIAGIFESMRYASMPFARLIQPAIDLAERGYSFDLGAGKADPRINTMPNVFDGKREWREGDTLIQKDLAATLKRIRDNGRKEFYEGKTAKLIAEEMKRGRGTITLADLKSYRAKWREPMQFDYRGYTVISMGLPSSGGILLNQMLKMIEPYPMGSYGAGSVKAISLMIEAERRAYKDRSQYLGDADYVNVPVKMLTDSIYLRKRMEDYVPGIAGKSTPIKGAPLPKESKETTHLSVVDRYGNAVSVTTTLNGPFGSGVVVGGAGFFLNNEMNDFNIKTGVISFSGGVGGANNAIAPGKRMLSSMSPTIVLKNQELFMVLGTPGGTTIPTSVFQTIVNVIDFEMSATEAVRFPKFHHEWMPDLVGINSRFGSSIIDSLQKMGYQTQNGGYSSMEVIRIYDARRKEIVSEKGSAEGY